MKISEFTLKSNSEEIRQSLKSEKIVSISDIHEEREALEFVKANFQILPQYLDTWVWSVEPKFEGDPTSISNAFVPLHTEMVEFEEMPDFLGLYCIRPADQGGELRLVNCKQLIQSFSNEFVEILLTDKMRFVCDPGIAKNLKLDNADLIAPM